MTEIQPVKALETSIQAGCADDGCTPVPAPAVRDAGWRRAAGQARLLAWVSLVWMCAEGAIGLWQGFMVGSIALIGWALGSAVEGIVRLVIGAAEVDDLGVDTPEGDHRGRGVVQGSPVSGGDHRALRVAVSPLPAELP